MNNISCVVVNAPPFYGGSGSGSNSTIKNNITCPIINVSPYLGGSGSGNSMSKINNATCTIINVNPFLGGSGSGTSIVYKICSCYTVYAPNTPHTITWIGGISNDWNSQCNWDLGFVPNQYSNVIVPYNTPPIVISSPANCKSLLNSGKITNQSLLNVN
ncbi:MAG: hypothetical protein NTW25_15880 [Candidatus Kapabacteria bacterium]|nr:hypothetical protein [Candidatus Kapabacteria bacterium]